jgi:hypothetical protein
LGNILASGSPSSIFTRSWRRPASSRPRATQTTYAHPQRTGVGLGRTGNIPPPGGRGGRWRSRPGGLHQGPGGAGSPPSGVAQMGARATVKNRTGSSPRENHADIKCPLWAKRCAAGANAVWLKGAILDFARWRAGTNGPSSGGLARMGSTVLAL